MVDGGSQQKILDLGFVLFGIRQQGVPVILRELVLPDEWSIAFLCSYAPLGITLINFNIPLDRRITFVL
ncbi:unnamed protein product [Schistosoma curassoni]|uniref:AMP-binding domain-containing protein n=1 Tax=Schistosoma curassoni TaxID=6186 RepID=A0A183JWW6_9TREM|nr:unnamed protein product [Schistosoma curassoni]